MCHSPAMFDASPNPANEADPSDKQNDSECSIYSDFLNIEAKCSYVVEQYGASHLSGDDRAQEQAYPKPRPKKCRSD